MKSQKVLCGSAKKWALVLGWIQAVSSAVVIGILSALFVLFVVLTHHNKINLKEIVSTVSSDSETRAEIEAALLELEKDFILATTGFVLIILAVINNFAGGVVLVQGVQNRNAKYLKIWMLIQFILLVLGIVGNIYCSHGKVEASWTVILNVLLFFISMFSIWVVNVHRQELLGNSGGQVIHSVNKL